MDVSTPASSSQTKVILPWNGKMDVMTALPILLGRPTGGSRGLKGLSKPIPSLSSPQRKDFWLQKSKRWIQAKSGEIEPSIGNGAHGYVLGPNEHLQHHNIIFSYPGSCGHLL